LDDLDRDELLHLMRRRLWRQSDLVWAQWEAACDRWEAAWDEYMRLGRATAEAYGASITATNALTEACRNPARDLKALDRLSRAAAVAADVTEQARAREGRAKAKADRIDRRKERLLALHKEMRDAG
jgi:hypothetical protein